MNRFQKKCFIVVAGMHGLLLLVLIVGTAFNSEKKIETSRVITLVNIPTVTDGPTKGGGSPAPALMAKPPEVVQPTPAPPVREPEPPKPVVETPKPKPVEPKKVEPVTPKVVQTTPKPTPKPVPKPPRTVPDISKPTIRKPADNKAANEAAEKAAQKAAAERAALVKNSIKAIGQSLSPSTTIEIPGGTGGAAEINYGDLVLSKYDAAWIAPAEVDDNEAIVKVRVVIARSGNVISADIVRASGNAVLDKSVRRALDSVRFIARFPDGSTDSQRTYTINFNLKTKRGIG